MNLAPTPLAEVLEAALARLLAAGPLEVSENGVWLARLDRFQYRVRNNGASPLLHLWSQDTNLALRVLRIAEELPERLTLEVSRLGQEQPRRFEFTAQLRNRRPGRATRERFQARFRELLDEQFADETWVSLATAAKLQHSLSGNYARGVRRETATRGARDWAVLGAAPGESAATYDSTLTFGLLWLDRARSSARPRTVAGLRLFVPEGSAGATAHRLQALSSAVATHLYEYDQDNWRARPVDQRDAGNRETRLVPRRERESILSRAASDLERVKRIAANGAADSIEAEPIPGTSEVALRFRGLLFARSTIDGLFFGVGDAKHPLEAGREPKLGKLIQELQTHRTAVTTDTRNPLFRAQSERWLETLVRADPTRVDPHLDPRFLYAQVPHFVSRERGMMDLLGVTRGGRLAVIELKAAEDPHLLFQGVDYWLRVRWHHAQQEFERYGYFPGITLDPRPPLLYLVAPSLRFHPATSTLLPFLRSEIEICRVGINESWRRGLKVVLRQNREAEKEP